MCHYTKQVDSSLDPASLRILDRLSVIETLVRDIRLPSSLPLVELAETADGLQRGDDTCIETTVPPDQTTTPSDAGGGVNATTDKLLTWSLFTELLSSRQRYEYVDSIGNVRFTYLDDLFNLPDSSPARVHLEEAKRTSSSMNVSTDREEVERLIELFFSRVNIKNPIISRHDISRCCQRYYEYGPMFNLDTALVLLACALGAVSMEFDPHDDGQDPRSPSQPSARLLSLQLGHCYFTAAEKRLGFVMLANSTLAVQCLCLAG